MLLAAPQYCAAAASTQAAVKGYLCDASWQALGVTTVKVQAVYKDSTPRHRFLQVKEHVPSGGAFVEYCSHPHSESLLLLYCLLQLKVALMQIWLLKLFWMWVAAAVEI